MSSALSTPETNPELVTLGHVMRQNRLVHGWSIREAAEKSGVSKNTIRRIESGLPAHDRNHEKLCRAYGAVPLPTEQFKQPSGQGKNYVLQKRADQTWYALRVNAEGKSEVFRSGDSLTDAERARLGRYGLATHFSIPLRCRRENTRAVPFLVEVHGQTDVVADTSGERFIYGIRGDMIVQAGEEYFVLCEGEAACFDSTLPTSLAAASETRPLNPAPLAVVVVLP